MGLLHYRRLQLTLPPFRYAPYGDSIAYGNNAFPYNRWSTIVANEIRKLFSYNVIEINHSIAGANVVDNLQPGLAANVLAYSPEIVVLAGGLNDMRLGTAVITFSAAYAQMIAACQADSQIKYIICCSLPHMIDYGGGAPYDQGSDAANHLYNTEIQTLASSYGKSSFADVHVGMAHNDALVDVDGVHPNVAGHANISATITTAIIAAFASDPI